MDTERDLDPFKNLILEHGIKSTDDAPNGLIARIIAGVDCIEHHDEFLSFINVYGRIICRDERSILSVMRACIAIEDLKGVDLSQIITSMADSYRSIVTDRPISRLDIDISLSFIRSLFDYGISIKIFLSALSLRIMTITDKNSASECYDIIVNHRDILENIYKIEGLLEYSYVLDDTISGYLGNLIEEANNKT